MQTILLVITGKVFLKKIFLIIIIASLSLFESLVGDFENGLRLSKSFLKLIKKMNHFDTGKHKKFLLKVSLFSSDAFMGELYVLG